VKFDKKMVTVVAIITVAIAGTAFASWRVTSTTETISFGSSPALTVATTTEKTTSSANAAPRTVAIATESPDAALANLIFRILGIPVSVQEVTTLKTRNLGYGEITLAYNLAHSSGRPVNEILAMRFDQKMGWGKIAKQLGVKLHGSADRSVQILRDANLDKDADDFMAIIRLDLGDEDRDDKNPKAADEDQWKDEHHDKSDKNHNKDQNKKHRKD